MSGDQRRAGRSHDLAGGDLARIGAGMPHPEFARLAGSDVTAVLIGDPHLDVQGFAAEAAGADVTRLDIGCDCRAGPGLRHRPAFDQRKSKPGFERRMQGFVDRGAETEAHRMAPVIGMRFGFLSRGICFTRLNSLANTTG